MSRLLGVVEQLYGEYGSRSLAVYDDALVVVPGDAGQALGRWIRAGAASAAGGLGAVVGIGAEGSAAPVPPEAAADPGLLAAAGPGRRLIPLTEIVAARLARSWLGLRRDFEVELRSGERITFHWPPLGPKSRDGLVLPVLRAALGDTLGFSA
jgi:hypothetical protein